MLPSEYRARAALAVRALDKARDLQGDLVDAMDVESVLVAVEDHAEIFNKVNVSTALHRVARLVTTRGMNQHGGSGGGSEQGEASSSAVSSSSAAASRAPHHTASSLMSDARFAKLMTLVEEKAGEMSAVSVSNALWATARLRYPANEALVEKLASRAATECAKAEPRHLSTVLWALAVLGHEPRSRLLAAVAERALETSGKFRAPDIVNMLWAYARWSPRGSSSSSGAGSSSSEVEREDPAAGADVVQALCAQALANLADFTPYQCANLAWSLAMLDAPIPGGASRGLGAILDRAASDPGSLDPTALTHALWAVGVKGTASDGNSGAFKTLLAEAASRAKRRAIGRAGAAGVVWACGRLRVTPRPGDAEALLGRLLDDRSRPGAEVQALVHAVWGVSQMEGVTMGEKHREETIRCVERLAREGRVSAAHAEALRASAAGAGVDPTRMEAALRAT
jgi:hypothetical protein